MRTQKEILTDRDVLDMLEKDLKSFPPVLLLKMVKVIMQEDYVKAMEMGELLAEIFANTDQWEEGMAPIARMLFYPSLWEGMGPIPLSPAAVTAQLRQQRQVVTALWRDNPAGVVSAAEEGPGWPVSLPLVRIAGDALRLAGSFGAALRWGRLALQTSLSSFPSPTIPSPTLPSSAQQTSHPIQTETDSLHQSVVALRTAVWTSLREFELLARNLEENETKNRSETFATLRSAVREMATVIVESVALETVLGTSGKGREGTVESLRATLRQFAVDVAAVLQRRAQNDSATASKCA